MICLVYHAFADFDTENVISSDQPLIQSRTLAGNRVKQLYVFVAALRIESDIYHHSRENFIGFAGVFKYCADALVNKILPCLFNGFKISLTADIFCFEKSIYKREIENDFQIRGR